MRLGRIGALVFTCGCGLISGLDQLTVDGGIDAAQTSDAPQGETGSDGGSGADVMSDVAPAPDACAYDGGRQHCFGINCVATGGCCLRSTGASCEALCPAGVSFACTDPGDCPEAGMHCCLVGANLAATPACPTVIAIDAGAEAVCNFDNCNVGKARLCGDTKDCPPTDPFCRAVTFSIDPNVTIGLCMPF